MDVEIEDRSDDVGLLALQGPRAREILAPLSDTDLDAIGYYRFVQGRVDGVDAVISATGYTGEDGFELYVAAADAVPLWTAIMKEGRAKGLIPAGLGARDSLRLEMGYALYGNDLDEEHTPLEASLGWITKLDQGDFVGRDALRAQKESGVTRRLVGLRLLERGFPRPGYEIRADGEGVGRVTSGTLSPSLGVGIAMGYVPARLASPGSRVEIDLRGKAVEAEVQRPPFYTEGSIRR
jgi:aminomethyltransferase